jgi:hypothetical protein
MVAKERVLLAKGDSQSKEPKGTGNDGKGGGKNGLIKIPLYLVPLAIFGLVWMIMSRYDVFFFWKAVSAVIVATASVSLIKPIFGLKKEESTAGPSGVVWCLFLLILVGHYATPKENLSAEKPKEKNGIVRQAGVLKNVGDVWVVDNIFYKNDEILIEVTGGPVEMVNGGTFLSGKYHQKADTTGSIGFEALSNEPTKIRVWFKK